MVDEQLTENFNLREFRCKDGSSVPYDLVENVAELARNLQVLRDELGAAIRIISGWRNPSYNAKIGGAKRSKHMEGIAGDIQVAGHTPAEVHAKIESLISAGRMCQGGLGIYPGRFVHYDTRGTKARWRG